MAVLMVRIPLAADDSLAAIRARSRFGMAIAAMIRMIATTISNSINEKPLSFCISFSLFSRLASVVSIDPIREFPRISPTMAPSDGLDWWFPCFQQLATKLRLPVGPQGFDTRLILADFVG